MSHISNLQQAQNQIRCLENVIELMKKQIAQETAERYAAYQKIAELQAKLSKIDS